MSVELYSTGEQALEEEQWVVALSFLPLSILFLNISEEQKPQFGERQAEPRNWSSGTILSLSYTVMYRDSQCRDSQSNRVESYGRDKQFPHFTDLKNVNKVYLLSVLCTQSKSARALLRSRLPSARDPGSTSLPSGALLVAFRDEKKKSSYAPVF